MAFKSYKFRVVGRGEFPFDMLRYDGCHPYDSESASKLATPAPYVSADTYETFRHKRRVVTLIAYRDNKYWLPTGGRWSSFGWTVISETLFAHMNDEQVEAAFDRGVAPNV